MHRIRTAAVAVVSTIALSGSALAVTAAYADEEVPPAEPCATQQAQVDKATAKLAWITEKFASKQEKVAQAKKAVKAADTAKERRSAKADLALAKEQKEKVAKAKKAQVQRVAKATARLEACLADQEPTEEPTEG